MHTIAHERHPAKFLGLPADRGGPVWQQTATALAQMSDDQLSAFDTGALNLFCALGLNGADDLDPQAAHRKLSGWARYVRDHTQACLPTFHRSPEKFQHSLPKCLMLCMVTALQRGLGIRYYMPFCEGEYNASDSRPMLIHGLLSGFGGACVSMPVLYVAIGRRLGYPLFLVRSKQHFFVRWEGGGERFNIEATAEEFYPYDDERYHRLPKPLTEQEITGGRYLRNLARREELACFFTQRAHCLFDRLSFSGAMFAFHLVRTLAPDEPNVAAKLAVATILHSALASAARNARVPGARIDLRALPLPEPVLGWEHDLMPTARSELDRIIRVTSTDCLFMTKITEGTDGCRVRI